MKQIMTRRTFLRLTALLGGGAMLAACAKPTPVPTKAPVVPTVAPKATTAPAVAPTTAPAQPTVAPTKAPVQPTTAPVQPTAAPKAAAYKEAPMLAEQVKAGKLPPVEQRLPKDPYVVKPFEKIGKYGGTLHIGSVETNHPAFSNMWGYGLFMYNQENTVVSADIAKSFKWSPDLKTLTVELREGHKWSDGQPFTTDDIMFWWEDVVLNKDLTTSINPIWQPGGKLPTFKKVSPTVVEIAFAVPWPTITDYLGRPGMATDSNMFLPKHYLSKYHIKYNPKADDLAKENKFDDWKKAFPTFRAGPYNSAAWPAGRPVVWPWMVESSTSERMIAVRNPYFYMVDTEGNQLPYIDKVESLLTGNKEVLILKTTSGEFDFESWYTDISNMAAFKQNADKSKYRILMPQSLRPSAFAIMPNRTVKDLVLRDLFNKKDFRVALSVAINRKAINDAVFFGLGKPFPAIPLPTNSFFKPEWASMYMEYDVAKANQLLDGLGLTKKDSQGFRLRSDGQRLSLLVEIGSLEGPKMAICEMVKKDWQAVGVDSTCQMVEGTLYARKVVSNDLVIGNWHLDRAGLFGRGNPLWFGFDEPSQQRWAAQWAIWYQSGGKSGIEPPDEIKKIKEIHNKWRETLPGTPEFNKLGGDYYDYFAKEIPMIGTVGLQPQPMVVKNNLRNVPEANIWWGSDTNFFQPYYPVQWYFES